MRGHHVTLGLVAGVAGVLVAWHAARGGSAHPAASAPPASAEHLPRCAGFDLPVGPPDGAGYYDAQPFGVNDHLGNDYNGVRGGDSDLGDPVYAIAAGVVGEATDHGGGWGNVVRIAHGCDDAAGATGDGVESLYAHLDTITVIPGQAVERGDRIGTIGTAAGQYPAHLHLELRDRPGLPLGGGYGVDTTGYLDPAAFIAAH
jgi:murein DD-endopeptidase MepM/ murein hydrolase activator NlpD